MEGRRQIVSLDTWDLYVCDPSYVVLVPDEKFSW